MMQNYYGLLEKRKRQIDTLKIFNDHVVELKENLEYRVEFTAGGKNMSLDVILGPEFPNEKPVLVISPMIVHPWIMENKIVAAPGLLNFTIHSDLGRVVHAIIREFEKNPPIPSSEAHNLDGNAVVQSPTSNSSGQDQSNALFLSPLPSVASGHTLPVTSTQFPQLNDLSPDDLQSILENVDLQDEILKTLPELISFDKSIDDLRTDVEELVNENLSKRNLLESLKKDITDDISSVEKLENEIDQRNSKLKDMSEPFSFNKIKDLLNIGAASADKEAENIVEEFLTGSIPADIFVSRYTEKRALGQSRRTKYDRMAYCT